MKFFSFFSWKTLSVPRNYHSKEDSTGVEFIGRVNVDWEEMLLPTHQGCQFGSILGAKYTFLLHKNLKLALKLTQTGNPSFFQHTRVDGSVNSILGKKNSKAGS